MVDQGALAGQIDQLNATLAENSFPYKLGVVSPKDIRLLEKNARYMTNETFRNLVDNVKADGNLSSIPFCVIEDGAFKVLSGNHRVMAAKEAGIETILILYTDEQMTRDKEIATQLSHNSIAGQDDPVILKALYDEINDVSLKYYAGLDDKLVESLEGIKLDALSEVHLDFRNLTISFLPEEEERLTTAFQRALAEAQGHPMIGRLQEFDRLVKAISEAQAAKNVSNVATALMVVLDIFDAHVTDLADGWDSIDKTENRKWPTFTSTIGTDRVPLEAARVIKRAVDHMVGTGKVSVKAPWQALEYLCADYLAGV
jgi:hypothetical protein